MGALWKVRRNLQDTLGAGPGGVTANLLHNAWMNAFDDSQIETLIEDHWLVLDDDDGNLATGTPHKWEIDAAFREQGFPGAYWPPVVWVDCAWNGPELGTKDNPFTSVLDGIQAVLPGGVVAVYPGTCHETPLVKKPLRITSTGGSALIGG